MTTETSVVSSGAGRVPPTGQYAWCINHWIPSSQKCWLKPQPLCANNLA
jgi:hypothetical protein